MAKLRDNESDATDPVRFTQFVQEHELDIYNYVLRLVGSREEAEDITQDALLQTYKTWSQVEPSTGGYIKWCYRIAHNLSIDSLRKKKPRLSEDDELERAVDKRYLRPEEVYEHRVESSKVREAVLALPEKYREVLILRYQSEASYERIAEILQVPLTTIETRIHRAKRMLRQQLENMKGG